MRRQLPPSGHSGQKQRPGMSPRRLAFLRQGQAPYCERWSHTRRTPKIETLTGRQADQSQQERQGNRTLPLSVRIMVWLASAPVNRINQPASSLDKLFQSDIRSQLHLKLGIKLQWLTGGRLSNAHHCLA
ncbi:hypothetical protein KTAU_16460 [Thermogemmatispora aurantia]|uniref:Uncharacterized protein n=1 Tax=Thermogemmatispora aurantia TaxID=2045279 RepID=A0A5J4K8H0_9CHLR|nr:hypothetical protein KTAU_16460 [Thermogemmatispora aurantia]